MTAAPFAPEGSTATLGILRAGIAAADGLLAVTTANTPVGPPEDGRFDWAGQHTDGQRAVLDEARGLTIRLIRPGGTVTTAAFGDRFTLHGGYLYVVVRSSAADRLLLDRVKLPA
ncbi:hypothetical protein [Kribbella sp. CA-294648]|uniref:hypothetical protein n=1 Tax=Kribbella sp. CA-294648 TaxID=3239948 RepID=UPI003D932B1C